jgi:hypothetical protein
VSDGSPPTDIFEARLQLVWRFGVADDRVAVESFAAADGATEYAGGEAVKCGVVSGPIAGATKDTGKRVLKVVLWHGVACGSMPHGYNLIVFSHGMACGTGQLPSWRSGSPTPTRTGKFRQPHPQMSR